MVYLDLWLEMRGFRRILCRFLNETYRRRRVGHKQGKENVVVVSFDPSTNKEQRDALAPMILKTYGLEWAN